MDDSGYRARCSIDMDLDGVHSLRLLGYGLTVFGVTTGTLFLLAGLHWWFVVVGIAAGAVVVAPAWFLSAGAGGIWKHMMVNGSSTPYVEQYSYQQALVMKGELDAALESFEAVIAEQPEAVDRGSRPPSCTRARSTNRGAPRSYFAKSSAFPPSPAANSSMRRTASSTCSLVRSPSGTRAGRAADAHRKISRHRGCRTRSRGPRRAEGSGKRHAGRREVTPC